jgi:hypothetical protein
MPSRRASSDHPGRLGAGRAPRRRGALLAGWGHRGVARAGGGGWHSLACASRRRRSKPSGDGPAPRLQVQPRVANGFKRLLALVDHLVQDPLSRIQVRVPDPVGVPGVKLVVLRHAVAIESGGGGGARPIAAYGRVCGPWDRSACCAWAGCGPGGRSGMGKPASLFTRQPPANLARVASTPNPTSPERPAV